MQFKKLTAMAAIVLAGLTIGLVPGAAPASASVGPGEDRQISSPAGWWTYTGVDAAYVAGRLSANGARLTDIKVEGGSPLKFTVTMVRNTGVYASGSWWYYGLTPAQVLSTASANNARPIAIHGYNTTSGLRFAVVMVSNTGANAEAWSFAYGTPALISSKVTSAKRIVSFGRIQGTGYYTALFGSNTGTDATGWYYYYGRSTAQLQSLAATNGARLVDLDRNNDNGLYNAVMYKNPAGTKWRFYTGYSAAGLLNKAAQDGQRLFDITPYYVGTGKYFAAVGVSNLTALENQLDGQIAPKLDSGTHGFSLKQVGGGQVAGLLQTRQFEPASSLKVLYHLKSTDAEESGTTTDTTAISYRYNLSAPADGDICPNSYATTATTNLKNADSLMMWNSDNRMTRGILEKYGKPSMLSLASSIGLTGTSINHNIGCPTSSTHNLTTLSDLGKVYEAFQNGSVVSSATWRANFRARMLNQGNTGFKNSICPIVQQEATKLGKSSAVATSFCNAITWISKGGSYQYGVAYPYTVDWSGASLTGVPFKSGGVVSPKYFTFGYFANGLQLNSDAEKASVNTALGTLYPTALRPQINAALKSGW
jgi:hypothetical protein